MNAMNPVDDFSGFQDEVFATVLATTKASVIVTDSDVDFQRSLDPIFADQLDQINERFLGLANKLLKTAVGGTELDVPRLSELDDVENKWDQVVEVADYLLEKADTCLDEYTGAIKQKNPEPLPGALLTDRPRRGVVSRTARKGIPPTHSSSRTMAKPQLAFEVKPNNLDATPFRPILARKPHAIVPFEAVMHKNEKTGNEQYDHPYLTEITAMQYPKHMFQKREPITYLDFEKTNANWVDTLETLAEMHGELLQANEIAIDLEHHDQRSYVGIVCLMQISTRNKDWIVDTLKLRQELQILNDVFADPSIIKVFHGAFMDVVWLQRDFGLYLVGLFDTYHASRALGFAGHSLAFLLKRYINFDADKQYQRADWRIRPLPAEMVDYARSDTHFLLYIWDHLRNELLDRSQNDPEKNKMQDVLDNSKETALKRYEREAYDVMDGMGPGGWRQMLSRGEQLSPTQRAVFKTVHAWRDRTAREEDESVHFVMPRHQLFNLSRRMPHDISGIFGCCNPPSGPLRLRASELLQLIRTAQLEVEKIQFQGGSAPIRGSEATSVRPTRCRSAERETPRIDIFSQTATDSTRRLRAASSVFWGNTVGSSLWDNSSSPGTCGKLDFILAVPLPHLTAAILINGTEDEDSPALQIPAHEFVKKKDRMARKEDTIMVVKSTSKKRNFESSASEEESTVSKPSSKEVDGDGSEEEESTGRPAERDADLPGSAALGDGDRRRRRRRKKQNNIEAFDYSKAESVLHGNRSQENGGDTNGKKRRAKKQNKFDPYSEVGRGDQLKGLGRSQREREGKSGTFK